MLRMSEHSPLHSTRFRSRSRSLVFGKRRRYSFQLSIPSEAMASCCARSSGPSIGSFMAGPAASRQAPERVVETVEHLVHLLLRDEQRRLDADRLGVEERARDQHPAAEE